MTVIAPIDRAWWEKAAEYQSRLTMPAGALGRVLEVGRVLCGVQETLRPEADPAAILVMAADHGVAEEGVSAYPQEVTGQMLANFLRGGAAINVLARRVGAQLIVADMGVKSPPSCAVEDPNVYYLENLRFPKGTPNFLREPVMTVPTFAEMMAVEVGGRIFDGLLAARGVKVLALGEMGIGNTTSATAVAAAVTGMPVRKLTGRGTGIDGETWKRKVDVIERGLHLHFGDRPGPVEPLEALRCVGGFEIAGLVGAALEAARRRTLVVLDGFISSVAGLVAARLEPAARDYFVASHLSEESGHEYVLGALQLQPLLNLHLRLGEGTGAALALPLIQAAADVMRDMATFDSAGVSGRGGRPG